MKTKQKNVAEFWVADDNSLQAFRDSGDLFDFNNFDSVCKFTGTHPICMHDRIRKMNWKVELDEKRKNVKWKYRILFWIEKLTGKRLFTFSNHKIIR